ncbi:MAG: hypothetical protein WKH64_03345 [Chloroflexia bacterium]
MDVLIRQAHPGPDFPHYTSFERKLADAQTYVQSEAAPWDVVVDDLQGTVHQVYGGMADPTYLIDADGRTAYYNMWTHAPTLHTAIEALLMQGGRGVVGGGVDRVIHMAAAMTDGWRGLRRGLPQSLIDIETAGPTTGTSAWLGYQLKPLLAPLTLRSERCPSPRSSASQPCWRRHSATVCDDDGRRRNPVRDTSPAAIRR